MREKQITAGLVGLNMTIAGGGPDEVALREWKRG